MFYAVSFGIISKMLSNTISIYQSWPLFGTLGHLRSEIPKSPKTFDKAPKTSEMIAIFSPCPNRAGYFHNTRLSNDFD